MKTTMLGLFAVMAAMPASSARVVSAETANPLPSMNELLQPNVNAFGLARKPDARQTLAPVEDTDAEMSNGAPEPPAPVR